MRYLISIDVLSEPTHEHRAYDSDEIFSAKVEGDDTIVAEIQKAVVHYISYRGAPAGSDESDPLSKGQTLV